MTSNAGICTKVFNVQHDNGGDTGMFADNARSCSPCSDERFSCAVSTTPGTSTADSSEWFVDVISQGEPQRPRFVRQLSEFDSSESNCSLDSWSIDIRSPEEQSTPEHSSAKEFDGNWIDCGVISNSKITWLNGEVTPLQTDGKQITVRLAGEICSGRLEGDKILWDDGDIWSRPEEEKSVPSKISNDGTVAIHACCGEHCKNEGPGPGRPRDPPRYSYKLMVARNDIDIMQRQAQQLRSTISRRRKLQSVSNPSDDVASIVSHYEGVLSNLELRIAELSHFVVTHSVL